MMKFSTLCLISITYDMHVVSSHVSKGTTAKFNHLSESVSETIISSKTKLDHEYTIYSYAYWKMALLKMTAHSQYIYN